MIFSLEAVRALHGDCLLVHFGSSGDVHTVLIDGGPSQVYGDALKPRLLQIRQRLHEFGKINGADPLPLALIMVSHIDDDHIGGLLALTDDPDGGLGLPVTSWVQPTTLWHNTFEELAGGDAGPIADVGLEGTATGKTAAVIASVPQGRALRAQAEVLGWEINRGFEGSLVQAPEQGGKTVGLGSGTSMLVVGPRAHEIERLRKEWNKQLKRLQRGETTSAKVAEYLDNSPYNLSSIVCLMRQADRSILLTGDARGDLILQGLDAAQATTNGTLHVNVLKLPHHGSIRDIDTDFFARITADHYVISASGRYGNPETRTLEMIAESRDTDKFTIHLTYAHCEQNLGERLAAFAGARDKRGRKFAISTRPDDALSLRIDLGDPPQV